MRIDFLKAYIMSLVAEGEFKLSDGPAILDRIVVCVLHDAKTALKDLAKLGAVQGTRHYANKVAAAVGVEEPFVGAAVNHYGNKFADLIEKEGFGGLWERLKKAAPKRQPGKPRQGLDHLIRK